MFLSLKTLYRKRTVIWPFYFYTIIRTLSYNIRTSLLDKLRNDKNIYVSTLNDLCNMLECDLSDIIEYTPDKNLSNLD